MTQLPSHKIPLLKVSEIIELLYYKNNADISEISKYANIGTSYTRAGIKVGILLNIIQGNTKDSYKLDLDVENYISKSSDKNNRLNMMKHYLQKWKPFISFMNFSLQGYSPKEAISKVNVLYELNCGNIELLLQLLIALGKELEIFEFSSDKIQLVPKLEAEYENANEIIVLEDNIATRLYIINNLGQAIFNFLQDDEIKLLIESYSKIQTNPNDSIHTTGKVVEDFLRAISKNTDVNVKDKNGINQLVNALYNYRNSIGAQENKIHSKQYNIGVAISDIRNMCGHDKEAKTERAWNVSKLAAISFFNLSLCTIRSIYLYVFENKYEF